VSDLFFKRQIDSGNAIFTEGDPGDCAYIIEQGQVEITTTQHQDVIVLARLGPGELFGEMSLIDGEPRNATATALADSVLMVVTNDQIESRLQQADPVLGLLLRVVLERFRSERKQHFHHLLELSGGQISPLEKSAHKTHHAALANMKLEAELRRALENDEFVLHYQPIVELDSGLVAGFETLIRWQHPERGLLSPFFFIGAAEQSTLMIQIGHWLIREACRSQVLFDQAQSPSVPQAPSPFIGLNISGRQLKEAALADFLAAVIRDTGARPQQIKLEITESLLINHDITLAWVNACRQIGFNIALDDFGTGYSSLSYLHYFPIDTLKIDKSFVFSMLDNQRSMVIIQTVLRLARELGMDVVAEGIEQPFELEKLRAMGCTYGQGYLLSRPIARDAALNLLRGSRRLMDLQAPVEPSA
jgi:EAL domain-containing protein (putative c-di-GMP-specific phosphodiesterase class I)/CRP-like cAMP-binding protein